MKRLFVVLATLVLLAGCSVGADEPQQQPLMAPPPPAAAVALEPLKECADFADQAAATAYMKSRPDAPAELDSDGDGVPCETKFAPEPEPEQESSEQESSSDNVDLSNEGESPLEGIDSFSECVDAYGGSSPLCEEFDSAPGYSGEYNSDTGSTVYWGCSENGDCANAEDPDPCSTSKNDYEWRVRELGC